jgi:hypothetical protein
MDIRKTLKILIIVLLILAVVTSGCSKRGGTGTALREQTPLPTKAFNATPLADKELQTIKDAAILKLSKVKVASVYERITDGVAIGRSLSDVTNILTETHTGLILKDFIRWEPVPETSGSKISGYPDNYVSNKVKIGYSYEQLLEANNQIKKANPDILLIGAISTQRLNRLELNEVTQQPISQSQTWDMAFDPAKYNLVPVMGTKEEVQCKAAKALGWISSKTSCPSGYNPDSVPAYVSDITNPQYQDLLVSRAEKQIDLGADGIWVDMLFAQAIAINQSVGDPSHPAVKASYEASSTIVDRIHQYGLSRGKYIYVGTWTTYVSLPYSAPALDFVTASPESSEVVGSLDDAKWNTIKSQIAQKNGNIPIITVLDWGGSDGGVGMALTAFSQKLTPSQQSAWLTTADDYFTKNGFLFAYPIHGGTFPTTSASLAFGKYNVYDSLAPEFGTYGTIKNLALKKAGN